MSEKIPAHMKSVFILLLWNEQLKFSPSSKERPKSKRHFQTTDKIITFYLNKQVYFMLIYILESARSSNIVFHIVTMLFNQRQIRQIGFDCSKQKTHRFIYIHVLCRLIRTNGRKKIFWGINGKRKYDRNSFSVAARSPSLEVIQSTVLTCYLLYGK